MGYYTHYSLDIYKKNGKELTSQEHSNVLELLEKNGAEEKDALGIEQYGDKWFMNNLGEDTKWYEHEQDMKEISKKFPELIFELNGEGEEGSDIWRKYFHNGKVQRAPANISFDSFNEKLLKD